MTDEQKQRIELWCQALESGEYQQERQMLKCSDRFCCLGVACDISGIGKWRNDGTYQVGSHSESEKLPREVRDWFGLIHMDPLLKDEEGSRSYTATDLNDGRGYTFPRIAAAIRRTYLEAV